MQLSEPPALVAGGPLLERVDVSLGRHIPSLLPRPDRKRHQQDRRWTSYPLPAKGEAPARRDHSLDRNGAGSGASQLATHFALSRLASQCHRGSFRGLESELWRFNPPTAAARLVIEAALLPCSPRSSKRQDALHGAAELRGLTIGCRSLLPPQRGQTASSSFTRPARSRDASHGKRSPSSVVRRTVPGGGQDCS